MGALADMGTSVPYQLFSVSEQNIFSPGQIENTPTDRPTDRRTGRHISLQDTFDLAVETSALR